LASSDTVVHPERGSESLCHNSPLKANPDRHPALPLGILRILCQFKTSC
jgi:hypothetical protein